MDDEQLERNLRSVGMRVFVEYFHSFNDDTLPNTDMADRLRSENFTQKSCRSRTSRARAIIRNGRLEVALQLIVLSNRVATSVYEKASRILSFVRGAQ